jgi:hypothetical protein
MLFNSDKCHILHLGPRNARFEYTMEGRVLEVVESEKDVGVIVHQSLKPSMQCAKARPPAPCSPSAGQVPLPLVQQGHGAHSKMEQCLRLETDSQDSQDSKTSFLDLLDMLSSLSSSYMLQRWQSSSVFNPPSSSLHPVVSSTSSFHFKLLLKKTKVMSDKLNVSTDSPF